MDGFCGDFGLVLRFGILGLLSGLGGLDWGLCFWGCLWWLW